MWMNRYEVEEARRRFEQHPILGPASQTLYNLMEWTDDHSDGWPYWQKPARAAEKLTGLLEHYERHLREHHSEPVITAEEYKAALRPIKAFRTRQEATFRIVEIGEELDPDGLLRDRVTVAQAALSLASKRLVENDPEEAKKAINAAVEALTVEVTA